MTEALVIVKQLPEIEEHLKAFKDEVLAACEEAKQLVVIEDTLTAVKAKRAELGKAFKELEDKRKEVKKQILAPYEAFEAVYKDCVSDAFKATDALLASRIAEVEDGLKEQKANKLKAYFAECCEAAGIDFVEFNQIIPAINRSVSDKKYIEQIKRSVDHIEADINTIETQDSADEIRAEYKKCLDLACAISTVDARHRAIQAERLRAEAARAEAEARAAAAAKVEEVIAAQEEAFAPPTEENEPVQEEAVKEETEKIYEVTFTVRGTREQIKELKAYMKERGLING